jgi:hypothetical protein
MKLSTPAILLALTSVAYGAACPYNKVRSFIEGAGERWINDAGILKRVPADPDAISKTKARRAASKVTARSLSKRAAAPEPQLSGLTGLLGDLPLGGGLCEF